MNVKHCLHNCKIVHERCTTTAFAICPQHGQSLPALLAAIAHAAGTRCHGRWVKRNVNGYVCFVAGFAWLTIIGRRRVAG